MTNALPHSRKTGKQGKEKWWCFHVTPLRIASPNYSFRAKHPMGAASP
jgi:hypothetical protein